MSISRKLLQTFFLALMAVLFSAALSISVHAASDGGGTVNVSALNFRSGPGTSHPIQDVAHKGDTVVVFDREGDWYEVVYHGVRGYVFSSYITPATAVEIEDTIGIVEGKSVRFRTAAGYDSDVITHLNTGVSLVITGVDGCWYAATLGETEGYIHSDYVRLRISDEGAAEIEDGGRASLIIEFAKQFMGTPYVYGGASPSGFDCSGFTSYVLKNNGFDSTRTCTTQYAQYEHISRSELKPGDLVFFASTKSWDTNHVGIYMGDNDFIHSSSGAGSVVISSLNDWYYDTYYYGAVRYLPD